MSHLLNVEHELISPFGQRTFYNFGQRVYRKLLQWEKLRKSTKRLLPNRSLPKLPEQIFKCRYFFPQILLTYFPIIFCIHSFIPFWGRNWCFWLVVMFKVLYSVPRDFYSLVLCIFDWFSCLVRLSRSIQQYNKCYP